MKKRIFYVLAIAAMCFAFCTSCNYTARNFGGNLTIELPAGEKLVEATWKDANVWYLTEPMEEGYVPKKKVFRENSNAGVLEGTVTFIEKR